VFTQRTNQFDYCTSKLSISSSSFFIEGWKTQPMTTTCIVLLSLFNCAVTLLCDLMPCCDLRCFVTVANFVNIGPKTMMNDMVEQFGIPNSGVCQNWHTDLSNYKEYFDET